MLKQMDGKVIKVMPRCKCQAGDKDVCGFEHRSYLMNVHLPESTEDDVNSVTRLSAYITLETTFLVSLSTFLLIYQATGHRLPKRLSLFELLLMGISTYKLSRIITRAKITMPLRAPFAMYEQDGGYGEVEEKPRGKGLQHAIGEAITCPYCIGLWIATALNCLHIISPNLGRFINGIFTTAALSDFLQRQDSFLKDN